MKMTIAWHQLNLKNSKRSLEDWNKKIADWTASRDRLAAEIAMLEDQIAEAKLRGLSEFDADKLLKKQKRKETK